MSLCRIDLARAIAFALTLGVALPAHADMHSLVGELRREPMSIFDWGLFILEEELQSVRRKQHDFLRVSYEPVNERIVVDAVFLVDKEEIAAVTAKRACYTRHHAIKLMFGIIDTDRIHLAPASDFRLGAKFSHRDSDAYPELPDAAKIGAELLKALYIKVSIASNVDEFPFDLESRCDGAALSQAVNYSSGRTKDALAQ